MPACGGGLSALVCVGMLRYAYFSFWLRCAKAEIERLYPAQDQPSAVPHREGKKERSKRGFIVYIIGRLVPKSDAQKRLSDA